MEQNRATIEAVFAFRDGLRAEMKEFRAEVNVRFSSVEAAIRQNSADIRDLKARLDGVEGKLGRVEAKLDQKADVSRLVALESRVGAQQAAP